MICPNCHQKGFSKWDSFGMASLNPKTCSICHKDIRPKFLPFFISMLIANILMIFVILFALEIAFNYLKLNLFSGGIFILLCIIIFIWLWNKIHTKYIPLTLHKK